MISFLSLLIIFGSIPVVYGLTSHYLSAGSSVSQRIYSYEISGGRLQGFFTANATIDVFISNSTGYDDYTSTGNVPNYAVWNITGKAGNFDLTGLNSDDTYYISFGNKHGSSLVEYQYLIFEDTGGIPGFQLFYLMFALVALMGIIYYKKTRGVLLE